MRENELHEPKIITEHKTEEDDEYYISAAYCPVCGILLSHYMADWEDIAVLHAKYLTGNYCNKCGARLKEI